MVDPVAHQWVGDPIPYKRHHDNDASPGRRDANQVGHVEEQEVFKRRPEQALAQIAGCVSDSRSFADGLS